MKGLRLLTALLTLLLAAAPAATGAQTLSALRIASRASVAACANVMAGAHVTTNAPVASLASDEVAKLVARLSSADAQERASAACALGRMEAKASAAVPRLVELLADGAAVKKTCGNESPFEDEEWEPDYETVKETTVGEAATQALMTMGDAAHDALTRALTESTNWRARKNAAWALAHRGDGQAVRAMRAALKDESWQVRAEAAYALFQRGGDSSETVSALIDASRDADARVRRQVVFALGHKSGGPLPVTETLVRVMREDADAAIREEAAGALWHSAGAREFPALLEALKDDSSRVRERAADTLGNRVGNDEVPTLIAALKDEDARVREGARRALLIVKQRSEGRVTNLRPLPPNVP
ncbi:MAG TPA: HEAT repeat domain-containing protein [Pyrinomonadaceae bacterium]|nr:HEAT repeat domain-containing protein [Pyrinomonadaceae bacterium]